MMLASARLNLTVITLTTLMLAANDANADCHTVCPSCPIASLSAALAVANAGDEITMRAGVYKEHGLIIDKSLTIVGEPGAVIDGELKGTIIEIRADDVSLSELTIKNVGKSHVKDFTAILVHRSKRFSLKNLTLVDVFFGIMIEKSKVGVIAGNSISGGGKEESDSGNGIHIWHSSKIRVENNEVFKLRDGIYFEFVKHSKVKNNRSHNNARYGLHFMFSNHDEYLANEFYENGAGVAVMFSKFIRMENNTFRNNWGPAAYGLLLKEIYDAEIVGNIFRTNTVAINTEGSTRINYVNNTFAGNGWAIRVTGACYLNIYRANDFLNNSFDVSYSSKKNDNAFEGNYWSSYSGYDLDKDGVGDVPYRPVKLFSYIVNRTPETIVLMRSLFVDIINFSERVSPVYTPSDIIDETPAMRAHNASL